MTLPYHCRDFLSPAELNFYRVLKHVVGSTYLICPKVNLNDLFYPKTGISKYNLSYRNKINRKHVDFVLCDLVSICPVIGIELDDSSHNRLDRQERDRFVEEVFYSSGLPLFRQVVKRSYNTDELSSNIKRAIDSRISPAPSESYTFVLLPPLRSSSSTSSSIVSNVSRFFVIVLLFLVAIAFCNIVYIIFFAF